MKPRLIKEGIYWMGAIDWDRRLFDSLIPLPDGTSYNAYLIQGKDKVALMDTVDTSMMDVLMYQLEGIKNIDYVVAHHVEQDHSGSIPQVLGKYKNARVLVSKKGKGMLMDLLKIPEERLITVEDGETLSLGGKTLEFIYTPWVHWPETMSTFIKEDRIVFTGDFFGSHIATSDLYVTNEGKVYEAAKRYYAEILMPFLGIIKKHLEKIKSLAIDLIAPSHGPIYNRPSFIIDAYLEWVSDLPKNVVVIPYTSMHGSTKKMVEYMVSALAEKGVIVYQFDLTATDLGKLAISLVEAATIVIGTPTMLTGCHPNVFSACYLVNVLRPKLKFASIIGSYGWSSRAAEQISNLIPKKMEILEPVLCRGYPRDEDFKALDKLAATIVEKHRELKLSE